ncbi:MAG: helix-turn-helix domain-containing protein [Candidatus Rokuibacteriota bacterium]
MRPRMDPADDKAAALRRQHALNPRPDDVTDPAFLSGDLFFDRRDLVQVKYEMLRRAREEGQPVSRAAAAFGFSRPSFYAARASFEDAGLPGLVPRRPGPRRAHKLSTLIVEALAAERAAHPSLDSADLARMAWERFEIRVHRRSVERALGRRKRGLHESP